MKRLIFQHISGNSPKNYMYNKGAATAERYANNIGCDYVLRRNSYFAGWHPVWEIFEVILNPELDHYDQVLFLDADVFVRNSTENLFDTYTDFSACKRYPGDVANESVKRKNYGNLFDNFFNSGIVFFNRSNIEKFKGMNPKQYMDKYKGLNPGRDQLALNRMAADAFDPTGKNYYVPIANSHAGGIHPSDRYQELKPTMMHFAGQYLIKMQSDKLLNKFWSNYFDISI